MVQQPSEFKGLPVSMVESGEGFAFECGGCNLRTVHWWANPQGAALEAIEHVELFHEPLPERLSRGATKDQVQAWRASGN